MPSRPPPRAANVPDRYLSVPVTGPVIAAIMVMVVAARWANVNSRRPDIDTGAMVAWALVTRIVMARRVPAAIMPIANPADFHEVGCGA
jgi:hypothetical protein